MLTVGPGLGHEWLRAIVVHEAAHAALAALAESHGPRWRSTYVRALRELYGVTVRNAGAAWRLDEAAAAAILEVLER